MKTQNILILALTFVLFGIRVDAAAADDISNIVQANDQAYENAIHTYKFMGNTETAIKTQRLLSGEHLLEVPAPEKPDAYFTGWEFEGKDGKVKFPYTVTDSDKKEVKVLPIYKKKIIWSNIWRNLPVCRITMSSIRRVMKRGRMRH